MRLLQDYQLAARAANRPLFALLLEALKLRFSVTRLGLSEYLDFQLYRDDLSDEERRSFGGYRLQSVLEEILVDDYSRFISVDKVTMYAVLGGHGFSIPEVRAVYGAIRPDSRLRLRNVEDLDRFLRTPGNLPVYVKPAFGAFGRGNMLLTRSLGTRSCLAMVHPSPSRNWPGRWIKANLWDGCSSNLSSRTVPFANSRSQTRFLVCASIPFSLRTASK